VAEDLGIAMLGTADVRIDQVSAPGTVTGGPATGRSCRPRCADHG
jgi:hypothetical protein